MTERPGMAEVRERVRARWRAKLRRAFRGARIRVRWLS